MLASYGHVRDLVPKEGAVDTEHDYAMKYQELEKNERHVKAIARTRRNPRRCTWRPTRTARVRRSPGICWRSSRRAETSERAGHQRVVFHEITRNAIRDGVQSTRATSSQTWWTPSRRGACSTAWSATICRRCCGRRCGAGSRPGACRVRRAAHDRRARAGDPRLRRPGVLDDRRATSQAGRGRRFRARLQRVPRQEGRAVQLTNEAAGRCERRGHRQALAVCGTCARSTKKRQRNPAAPFTTSTLQQEAARKLGFRAAHDGARAAALRRVDLGAGQRRPDHLHAYRLDATSPPKRWPRSREVIAQPVRQGRTCPPSRASTRPSEGRAGGPRGHPPTVRRTATRRRSRRYLSDDQYRLYELIWKRFVASQMADAVLRHQARGHARAAPPAHGAICSRQRLARSSFPASCRSTGGHG